ncbi:Protein Gp5, N-terminal OB-fold domain containing protein [uncultured Caudovirales phage]|uniref:Protein Gp5, N-terminal OB-fold domain containing protein n=1 Tax=uncultured Caudovirales phage TaxID=2100421 RepID=A0A6J5P0S2_9CAUD|nr:Protein Gp5, N-terminal OB-fold domain containing protein [uncultured Caudovirales phage]
MAKIYFAEVRDIMDPLESGRVKIRKYIHENDENNIKDDHLPWAITLMPTTSASTTGVGVSPVGLIVGSRVIITYSEDDVAEQYPIVLGSFYRSSKPKG